MLLHFLLASLLLFVVRIGPMLTVARRFAPSDVIAHSMMVQYGKHDPKGLLKAEQNYPIVIHYLLAQLPIPIRAYVLVPFLFDLVFLAVLAGGFSILATDGLITQKAAILTLYLFPFYPAFVIQFYGPRSYGLNERIVAEVLFGIAAFLLIVMPTLSTALAAALLLGILLLGSKFSVQAIVLLLLPAGLILGSPYILGAIAAAFSLALLAPGQNFIVKLRNQAAHLHWYTGYLKQPGSWAGERNKLPWPRGEGESLKSLLGRIFRFTTRDNAILAGLWGHTLLLLAMTMAWREGLPAGLLHNAGIFVTIAIAVWLLTSFGVFKVLGEAERYLNHAAGPGFLIIAWLLSRHAPTPAFIIALFAVLAALWLVICAYLAWSSQMHWRKRKKLDAVVEWANAQGDDIRMLSLLPTHDCWILTSIFLERFWWFNCFMRADWKDMLFSYPYLKFDRLDDPSYGCLVTQESILEKLEQQEPRYSHVRRWKLLAKVDDFLIYKIPAAG